MTFPDGTVKEGQFENNIFLGGGQGQSQGALILQESNEELLNNNEGDDNLMTKRGGIH